MEIETKTPKKKSLTRFNVVYDDPYEKLCNYLRGEISIGQIGLKCHVGEIYPEFRSTLYKIFLGILPYNDPASWKKRITKLRQEYYDKLNALLSKNSVIITFINDFADYVPNPVEKTFKICGSESNPFEGKISNACPLGEALIGKKEDDIVEVKGKNVYSVKIIKLVK